MPRWPLVYGPLGLPVRSGGNDAHHPTVFCYTNIEPRAVEIVRSTKRPARTRPAERARGRRDLISSAIGRPRVLPPPPPPSPSTANLHHLRIHLLPPSVSSRVSRTVPLALPTCTYVPTYLPTYLRSSSSSSSLSSVVVHEPLLSC